MTRTEKKTIAIIGGGISGLSAAYVLQKEIEERRETITFLLVEKENRLGGSILTEKQNGFIIEGGPDCFLSEKLEAIALCHRLGIQDQLMKTNETVRRIFIFSKGTLRELPEGFMFLAPTNFTSFIKNPLISPLGKLRMAMDLIIPAKKNVEEESLAQFVSRRLGKEVLEKIAEPLVAGIHASDPETMSLKSTFPRLIELEREYRSLIIGMIKRKKMLQEKKSTNNYTMFMSLKEGLATLPKTLTDLLNPQVFLTGNQVIGVEKDPDSSGYFLRLTNGDLLKVRSVVFATPAFVTADLLKEIAPSLSLELSSIQYVSTATISLAYERKAISYSMNGFGFVVPRIENRKIMASTWTSVKFAHRAPPDKLLIRCFVGGIKNEYLARLGDTELIMIVRKELRDIMGINAEPLFAKVFRWEKSMPQYTVGHEMKMKRIEERLSLNPGVFLAGNAYYGIGISDCIRSGEKAARAALKFLSR
ncbi:MAG TPA: protoporphyrinogen oxidase [Thermodesulfobacteriota bacterium]|nr:protoporphyrinogen oxidase [Thermodesulfobacteriota bacterium]